jgi:hypothetical protein
MCIIVIKQFARQRWREKESEYKAYIIVWKSDKLEAEVKSH